MTPETPSDPELRYIHLEDGKVSYTESGQGPPLVLVHGLPGSQRDFRWLAPPLEAHFRVIRPDMPAFGDTPLATGPGTSLPARGDFVAAVVEALDLRDVVVLGHSMGGGVAAAAVSRHPGRFRALGLVASLGTKPHQAMRRVQGLPLISALTYLPPTRAMMLPRLRSGFEKSGFKNCNDEQLVHTMRCLAGTDFRVQRAHLRSLRVPTLVASSIDDPIIEPAIADALYWAVPAGPRIRYSDGGHLLQKTRAVELAEALRIWVGGL